jgi:drug/metabolite transporter (DMT)-like permease
MAVDVIAPRHAEHKLGLFAIGIAISAWGVTGVIIKSIAMDSIAIAFWRFLIYAAILTVWLYARGGRLSWRIMRLAAPGGLLLSLDVILFFTAVKLTNVVNATTIGAMQPLVIAGFASHLFGERIRMREIGAALVAITGVIVVITQSSGTPEWSGAGDLAAVGALFAWSGYFIFAKRSSATLSPLQFTAGTAWWTAIVALPVGFAFDQDMSTPPGSEWVPLIALLLIGGVLGHTLMNWGLVRVPLWLSSTLTLLIPVVASIAAWIFLDEPLTAPQVVAMGVVVAALAVIVTAQTAPAPLQPSDCPTDAVV